jgi:hypothetical protein
MARLNNLILVLLVLCLPEVLADSWNMAPGTGAHGAGIPAIEGFEGTGIPNALWTDLSSSGTVNWDYSAAPIAGAQSAQMVDVASGQKLFVYDFPQVADEIWCAWRYRESADPAAFQGVFNIVDSTQSNGATVRVQTNGSVVILVQGTPSAAVIDLTPGADYRIKIRYKRGTLNNEEMEIWAAAEGAGAWGTSVLQNNGTSTTAPDQVYWANPSTSNMDQTIDNVMVSTSDIPWSALD